jgi:hypothetical protein
MGVTSTRKPAPKPQRKRKAPVKKNPNWAKEALAQIEKMEKMPLRISADDNVELLPYRSSHTARSLLV